ncbi:MAG: hypothetical protein IJU93_07865 [Lachnospiraceae bacterium]|nr:hypothetical protein [Lachnospiraceae bacterium]
MKAKLGRYFKWILILCPVLILILIIIQLSGLLSMSDIYMAIYMIDLNKNEIIPVVETDSETISRPKEQGANEQLHHLFALDRIEGRTPERVLFTIQVIENEKREMKENEQKIFEAA